MSLEGLLHICLSVFLHPMISNGAHIKVLRWPDALLQTTAQKSILSKTLLVPIVAGDRIPDCQTTHTSLES